MYSVWQKIFSLFVIMTKRILALFPVKYLFNPVTRIIPLLIYIFFFSPSIYVNRKDFFSWVSLQFSLLGKYIASLYSVLETLRPVIQCFIISSGGGGEFERKIEFSSTISNVFDSSCYVGHFKLFISTNKRSFLIEFECWLKI